MTIILEVEKAISILRDVGEVEVEAEMMMNGGGIGGGIGRVVEIDKGRRKGIGIRIERRTDGGGEKSKVGDDDDRKARMEV